MSDAKLKEYLARVMLAILETLKETNGGPETMIYLGLQGLGINIDQFNRILGELKRRDLIKIRPDHWVELTPKGLETVS